jgi:hypothetical protein
MGQAKKRGTPAERAEQAKARIAAIETMMPKEIICNHCQAAITDIQIMDSKGMPGIEAVFGGHCDCGHTTLAIKGE